MAVSPKLLVLGVLAATVVLAQVVPPAIMEPLFPERTPAQSTGSCDATTAFVMSQTFVKRQLKAPSTASFPWSSSEGVTVRETGRCRYQVTAYVDSENSFGAKMRTPYTVHLSSQDGGQKWNADLVAIR